MKNNSKVLVCGSISYDTIMVFQDQFKNHILPKDIEILNLAFHVPELRREYGGCAANICYNMSLLGSNGLPVATVGDDFENYKNWFIKNNINQHYIKIIEGQCTPQDYITTDIDNNQIAAFHPGALDSSHKNILKDFENVSMGIISPDGIEGMKLHAKQFYKANIPFLFDPGQVTPLLTATQLTAFIKKANWAVFNAYEWEVFYEKTKLSHDHVRELLDVHIVTEGSKGAIIYLKEQTLKIPVAKVSHDADPTGCGDAFRSGIVFGLLNNLDWNTTGEVASLMGAYSYESKGSQNHRFNHSDFYKRFILNYGENKELKRHLLNA